MADKGQLSDAQTVEFKNAMKKLKQARRTYNRKKILLDAIKECLSYSYTDLEPHLKKKIENIVRENSCSRAVHLENRIGEASLLLGVTRLKQDPLSHEESNKLDKAVASTLLKTEERISTQFKHVTGEYLHEALAKQETLAASDRSIFELRTQVAQQQQQYVENLQKEAELLDKIAKLTLERLPTVCEEKIRECELVTRVNVLRSKIVRERSRVDVFTESEGSLAAYEALMRDIKEQQEECRGEINDLKKLKEKYGQVACKQFDELLRSFVECKLSLEKKKKMYDTIHNRL